MTRRERKDRIKESISGFRWRKRFGYDIRWEMSQPSPA